MSPATNVGLESSALVDELPEQQWSRRSRVGDGPKADGRCALKLLQFMLSCARVGIAFRRGLLGVREREQAWESVLRGMRGCTGGNVCGVWGGRRGE